MLIYYCITIIANIAAALIFCKNINISTLSILPVVLIALMIVQVLLFKYEKVENGFRTNYGSILTTDEENDMTDFTSKSLFVAIPLMIPFILFFPSSIKTLSVLIYFAGLIGGLLIYRIKNKGKINNRMDSEKKEREEQEKKEELGKWR